MYTNIISYPRWWFSLFVFKTILSKLGSLGNSKLHIFQKGKDIHEQSYCFNAEIFMCIGKFSFSQIVVYIFMENCEN